MADGVEFSITGLEGVLEKLRTLGPRLQKNGLRKAARRAMNIVRDAAREKARLVDDPETPEIIWKNIITQESAKQGRREGGVVMKVGVRGGAGRNQYSKDASGNPGGDTRHWRYLEFGTKYSPAKPFMRPALSQNIEPVTEKFISELDGEIDKALRGR
ncbi:TPA: HK97 gp10 family phage protein [Pseudomonas aeruginosa]|nr:HK97 gp10 family phage protein [Pseudomonas aeruginosa]